MSDTLGGRFEGSRTPLSTTAVYVRAVALLLLAAGLVRACQILGITPDGSDFSDLAPAWQTGATTLALVDLFAAVGLWVGAAWGPVMWAVALAVEISMYTLFSAIFGSHPALVAAHGAMFAIFLGLSFWDWRRTVAD